MEKKRKKKKQPLPLSLLNLDLEVGERLMVAAERWLWVREMVATMAVVWVRERERELKILGGFDFLVYHIRTQIRRRGSEKIEGNFSGQDKDKNRCSFEILFNAILTVKRKQS